MEKIKKIIKKSNIKFLRFQFTDAFGNIKSTLIPAKRLEEVFENGLKCDGSSIVCCKDVENSDIILKPDKNAILMPDNILTFFVETNTDADVRANLKQIINVCKKAELNINIGAELEFFLFKMENDKPILNDYDDKKYFDLVDKEFLLTLTEIGNYLQTLGFEVEALHHECGKNQFELDFKYDSPLKTADRIVTAKNVIKHFARKNGLYACFMPKPLNNVAGSGMHINISIFNGNKNLFYSEVEENKISQFAKDFIAGIVSHVGAITAFANPIVNSYKRLLSGFEAPTKIETSAKNRNALIRIPQANEKTTRIELRSPDISCNPYLTFSAIIMAGLENLFIDNKNYSIMPLSQLPNSLKESLDMLKADPLLSNLVTEKYFTAKYKEHREFISYVSEYDLNKYL